MGVAIGGDGEREYPPAELAPGSPLVPPDRPRPFRGDRVFVDTSVILGTDCRLPLLLLADARLLQVFWSPHVAAEVARVSTREQALETVRRGSVDAATLQRELEQRRREIDRVDGAHRVAGG